MMGAPRNWRGTGKEEDIAGLTDRKEGGFKE
jgi:hypothetical protein